MIWPLFFVVMVLANLGICYVLDEGFDWPGSAITVFAIIFNMFITYVFFPYFQ